MTINFVFDKKLIDKQNIIIILVIHIYDFSKILYLYIRFQERVSNSFYMYPFYKHY